MKKIYFFAVLLIVKASILFGQESYITPAEGYKAIDILPSMETFSTFDVHNNYLYTNDGNTIQVFDLATNEEIASYDKPSDYASYPSFLTVSPAGDKIYAGYTVSGNTDDRIYAIDPSSETWEHVATLAGNFDLEFCGENPIISGAIYGAENIVYLLDESGENNHIELIQTGGNSAGIAFDGSGNLYFASAAYSYNQLLRWSNTDITAIINGESSDPLTVSDAEVLSDLAQGAYDVEVDTDGNVIFNVNDYSSEKQIALWNGTIGTGTNYDVIATTDGDYDWFTMVKAQGSVSKPYEGNRIFALSWGRPIAEIHTDYIPVLAQQMNPVQGYIGDSPQTIDLSNCFNDPDDENNLSFALAANSNDEAVSASVDGSVLSIEFTGEGQSNIFIEVSNAGTTTTEKIVAGGYPLVEGEYHISDISEFTLDAESYWNGSDESGAFVSGVAQFNNSYNVDYASWTGWAYSNVTDNTTAGWSNQYGNITGSGYESETTENDIFALSFVSTDYGTGNTIPVTVNFTDNKSHVVQGFYVTNSTYAALSMKYGDDYSKKFGGETGNDEDWFKLSVWGYKDGSETEVVDFYLADYRFEDNTNDYIIETWQWIDLTDIGAVDSLKYALSSTDVGDYGMNTPAYFCLDNMVVSPAENGIEENSNSFAFATYPNPSNGSFTVSPQTNEKYNISVSTMLGQIIYSASELKNATSIQLENVPPGTYILTVKSGSAVNTKQIIIN